MATTQTLTLTEFLLTRIAEDEERVSQAIGTTPWAVNPPNLFHHVALRHLGDCEAKRRLVALHPAGEHPCPGKPVEWIGYRAAEPFADWWCSTLVGLALPYADHPDYRDEWRPRGQYGPTADYGDG